MGRLWHRKVGEGWAKTLLLACCNQEDSPEPRPIQAPDAGRIIAIPEVGGLHHRYERRAA